MFVLDAETAADSYHSEYSCHSERSEESVVLLASLPGADTKLFQPA
jgi:hypothetical protein